MNLRIAALLAWAVVLPTLAVAPGTGCPAPNRANAAADQHRANGSRRAEPDRRQLGG